MKVRLKFLPTDGPHLSSEGFELDSLFEALKKGKPFEVKIMCDDLHKKKERWPHSPGHESHTGSAEIRVIETSKAK